MLSRTNWNPVAVIAVEFSKHPDEISNCLIKASFCEILISTSRNARFTCFRWRFQRGRFAGYQNRQDFLENYYKNRIHCRCLSGMSESRIYPVDMHRDVLVFLRRPYLRWMESQDCKMSPLDKLKTSGWAKLWTPVPEATWMPST